MWCVFDGSLQSSPAGPSLDLPQQYQPEKGLKLPTRKFGSGKYERYVYRVLNINCRTGQVVGLDRS